MSYATHQENIRLLRRQFSDFMKTAKVIMQQLDDSAIESQDCPHANIALIQQIVCNHYQVPITSMTSAIRTEGYALPRQVAMVLSRDLTKHVLREIGRCFKRDHGTVSHASNAIASKYATNPAFAAELTHLRAECEKALAFVHMPLFRQ